MCSESRILMSNKAQQPPHTRVERRFLRLRTRRPLSNVTVHHSPDRHRCLASTYGGYLEQRQQPLNQCVHPVQHIVVCLIDNKGDEE